MLFLLLDAKLNLHLGREKFTPVPFSGVKWVSEVSSVTQDYSGYDLLLFVLVKKTSTLLSATSCKSKAD